MLHPLAALELSRAHIDELLRDGGGPRRPKRSREHGRGRIRLAVGIRLMSAGQRLLGTEMEAR